MRSSYVIACLFLQVAVAAPVSATVLKFSMPTGENTIDKDQMTKTLNKMFEVMKAKTGVTVILDPVQANTLSKQKGIPGNILRLQEYERRLKAKSTDIVAIMPEEYFLSPILQQMTTPVFTWTVNQKKFGPECIYVKAGSPYKSLNDLKGKRFSGIHTWLTLRKIMTSAGVTASPKQFFGQLQLFTDPAHQYQALVDGKTDAFHDSYQGWFFYKNIKPAFKAVKPLACIQNQPFLFFAMRKGTDQTVVDKVLGYLVNAHKDPAMGIAKWFFLAFNGAFVRIDGTYFDGYKALVNEGKSKGWTAEAEKWRTTEGPAALKAFLKAGGG